MAGEMADIWDGEGFTVESLTAAINNEPYRPGQVSASGIFEEDGVRPQSVDHDQARCAVAGVADDVHRGRARAQPT